MQYAKSTFRRSIIAVLAARLEYFFPLASPFSVCNFQLGDAYGRLRACDQIGPEPGWGCHQARQPQPAPHGKISFHSVWAQEQILNVGIRASLGTDMKRHSNQRAARRRRANAIVCFMSKDTIHTNPTTKTKWCLTRIHISSQISSAVLSATRLPDLSLSLAFVIGNAPANRIPW